MGQVLAVISGKGGTGKTSVCAGVAGCLCMEGARVLCIDADLGLRNLDISLGMASEAGLSFLDVMRGDYAIEQAPRAAGLPGLQLLTAPVSVKADEIDRGAFEALIHDAKERYDWVLISPSRCRFPSAALTIYSIARQSAKNGIRTGTFFTIGWCERTPPSRLCQSFCVRVCRFS